MNKKKAIKLVTASALAASSFAAVAPFNTEAAVNVASSVKAATDSASKAFHAYTDVAAKGQVASVATVQSAVKSAQTSYQAAKKIVNSYKGKDKSAYLAKLAAASKNITLAQNYITAVNYATGLKNAAVKVDKATQNNAFSSADFSLFAKNLNSAEKTIRSLVSGKTAADAVVKSYLTYPKAVYNLVGGYSYANAAYYWMAKGDLTTAQARLDSAAKYFSQGPTASNLGKAVNAFINKVKADYAAKLAPKVESVSAINGKELVVTFNQALDATDAVIASNYKLNGANIGIPTLSQDGKVVTITTSGVLSADNATLEISPISTKADVQKTTAKYVTLFSYKDTVAPTVAKVEAKATQAVITFAEELNGTPGLSVNGVNYSNYSVSGKTLTISGLENEKSYSAEIVGAKDNAGNISNPISLNFTVAKPDAVLPQAVTTSVKDNKVTLTFVNALSSTNVAKVAFKDGKAYNGTVAFPALSLDGTDAAGVTYSTDKKTVTLDAQGLGVLAGLNFLSTGIEVSGAGLTTAASVTATLNSDKTAAQLVSSQTTAAGKLVLEFNEPVVAPATIDLSVLAIDDIYQSTPKAWTAAPVAYAKDAQGKDVTTKLEVTLPGAVVVGTKYTVEVPASVKDVYNNATAKFNVSVVKPATDNSYKPGEVITVGKAVNKNVITLSFGSTKDDKGVTTSATTLSNYTLGGKALPTGTQVRYIDDKNHVEIVLPAGAITTTGEYVLEMKNITDAAGNTVVASNAKQVVTLVENVAPVATSVVVKSSSQAVVNFSENIAAIELTATGYQTGVLDGVTVKVNGQTVAAPLTVGTNTLTIDNLNLKATDTVSVEFKNAEIFDVSANPTQIKDSVITK